MLAEFAGTGATATAHPGTTTASLPAALLALCREQRDGPAVLVCSQSTHQGAASGQPACRITVAPMTGRFLGTEQRYLCVTMVPGARNALSPSAVQTAGFGLTRREAEIVGAMASGHGNAQIAAQLFISCNTVKNHLKNIFDKVGVRNRTELLARLVAAADRTTC
ncbi:MAG: response regulator transcription factor [Gammaproteobacteria bacterium]|nr:MAG: response regulator transcription factor [Gammaproteobacteria bacterium]